MKIAIIGSRNFNNYELLFNEVQKIKNISEIISGGAIGADTLAEKYANENNIKLTVFLPNWTKYGKKAGYIRNFDIITNSDFILAFWDNKSKGTEHSINLAKKQNKQIKIIYF